MLSDLYRFQQLSKRIRFVAHRDACVRCVLLEKSFENRSRPLPDNQVQFGVTRGGVTGTIRPFVFALTTGKRYAAQKHHQRNRENAHP